ncbi:MAG TPA: Hsp20/alpha crystallin family protein [Rhodospirillales bacterium]|mgnify:CR=1 FL=1|nr:Hsp20/alpha crystallin family protein [Rhodospirillales bacterium]
MAIFGPGSQDPWGDAVSALRRMQEEMNRTLAGSGVVAAEYPPVNVWRGEEGIVVTAEVPGVSLDDIEVVVHQNTLTIKGRRGPAAGVPEASYHRRERIVGPFARTIALPFNVDAGRVSATADAGVLTIELPRPEADKPKRINIATA